MKSPESPRVRSLLEALGCPFPDFVNFWNICSGFSCKAPSKICLLLPHVCSVGLPCNLETCNGTNCGCRKKKIWSRSKLSQHHLSGFGIAQLEFHIFQGGFNLKFEIVVAFWFSSPTHAVTTSIYIHIIRCKVLEVLLS